MQRPSSKSRRHVVVIGAGFAGLSAARCLLDRGNGSVNVTVLEGAQRVGGRAHTAMVRQNWRLPAAAT